MSQRWLVERDSKRFGPYSMAQLQVMASGGQLTPTDALVQEGAAAPIEAAEVPGLHFAPADLPAYPGAPKTDVGAAAAASAVAASAVAASPKKARFKRKDWPWLAAGAGVIALAVFAWSRGPARPAERSDLPEMFSPDYRIKRMITPAPANGLIWVDGRGWLRPQDAPAPGDYTEAWLEEKFTHYLSRNAFAFEDPEIKYPCAGKLFKGERIVLGEIVGDFTLVCKRTKDNRPINMYVLSHLLQDRASGPPLPDDDR